MTSQNVTLIQYGRQTYSFKYYMYRFPCRYTKKPKIDAIGSFIEDMFMKLVKVRYRRYFYQISRGA